MKSPQGCHTHHDHDGRSLNEGLRRLKDSGLKVTAPRRTLMKAILELDGPFTTDEAFQRANRSAKAAKCDLVTVYRSLSAFAESKILSKVDFGDGVVRYEWSDPQGHHHHHFICNRCAKVEPLHLCETLAQEKRLKAAGYTNLSHRLEFFGLCPDCATEGS